MHDQRTPVYKSDIKYRLSTLYSLFLNRLPPLEVLFDEFNGLETSISPFVSNYTLQDWVCDNLKSEFDYATGLSVIESINSIVVSQIENGGERIATEEEERDLIKKIQKHKKLD